MLQTLGEGCGFFYRAASQGFGTSRCGFFFFELSGQEGLDPQGSIRIEYYFSCLSFELRVGF